MMAVFYVLIFFVLFTSGLCGTCQKRSVGNNATICVCDKIYCDELVLLTNVTQPVAYESSKDGSRFESTILNFSTTVQQGVPVFTPIQSHMYQFILGFGGAFTDAAGININSLPTVLQKMLLNSYFSENGLEYNMGRIPMASCDFSTHNYSYDDINGDLSLKYFELAKEDFLYKIPLIHAANALSKNTLLLFGSPWSAPAWMKTNGDMKGRGSLIGEPGGPYYKTWANYFIKFLNAYKDQNITFWGLTMQNEPTNGCLTDFWFQSMCFTPEKQRDFLKLDLGPALRNAGYGPENLKLMILDDDRGFLPRWADIIMSDKDAAQYVSGIGFHWYNEDWMPHKLLDITHGNHPELFLFATEACTGYRPWELPKVDLGNWDRAERYAHDIIQDLLNWSMGWTDWNLALDLEGGPNWVKNFVDAPIIVNAEAQEFYKQPMYYILAHFSKCLPRGSYRIGLDLPETPTDLEIAAFMNPKDQTVVIILNRSDEVKQFALHDAKRGYLNLKIKPHTIQSYIW